MRRCSAGFYANNIDKQGSAGYNITDHKWNEGSGVWDNETSALKWSLSVFSKFQASGTLYCIVFTSYLLRNWYLSMIYHSLSCVIYFYLTYWGLLLEPGTVSRFFFYNQMSAVKDTGQIRQQRSFRNQEIHETTIYSFSLRRRFASAELPVWHSGDAL